VSRKALRGQNLIDRCGTPAYIAPEVLEQKGYDGYAADVWSAGVVLYAMLYGVFPFRADNAPELEAAIRDGKYVLPADVSEEARELVLYVLEPDPKLRLTIPEILEQPWMRDADDSRTRISRRRVGELFTAEEKEAITREYSFREAEGDVEADIEGGNDVESSIFTEHHLDTTENEDDNTDLSRSAILAPFNTVEHNPPAEPHPEALLKKKKNMIKFSSKLRELDRCYERNNNSQLDNGVYLPQAVPLCELYSEPDLNANPNLISNPGFGINSAFTPAQLVHKGVAKAPSHSARQTAVFAARATAATSAQSFYRIPTSIGTPHSPRGRSRHPGSDGKDGIQCELCGVLALKQ
jgi:serine/threonine protein kinase